MSLLRIFPPVRRIPIRFFSNITPESKKLDSEVIQESKVKNQSNESNLEEFTDPYEVSFRQPRLEEYHYNTILGDLMILSYRHDSPLAPAAKDMKKIIAEEEAKWDHLKSLTTIYTTPLEQLPSDPQSFIPVTSLLASTAAKIGKHLKLKPQFGRRKLNIIDYTSITKEQFKEMDIEKHEEYKQEVQGFKTHFSPFPTHLPCIRSIALKIWDERAATNKNILLPALLSLEAISGIPAVPLFATREHASKRIREGMHMGAITQLKGPTAYDFLDKLVQVVLPKLREWYGVEPIGNGKGTISFKLPVGSVGTFPDIEPHFDLYPMLFEIEVIIVTTAGSDEGAVRLLSAFQVPFRNKQEVLEERAKMEALREVDEDPFAKFKNAKKDLK